MIVRIVLGVAVFCAIFALTLYAGSEFGDGSALLVNLSCFASWGIYIAWKSGQSLLKAGLICFFGGVLGFAYILIKSDGVKS